MTPPVAKSTVSASSPPPPPILAPFTLPAAHLPVLEQAVAARGNAVLLSGAAYGGAVAVAQASFAALNCTGARGMAGEACGTCPSCRVLAAGAHPDLLHLRPRSTTAAGKAARRRLIPIGAIVSHRDSRKEYEQHVLEFLEIRPTYARRVVLIHGAEFLGPEAANALLKLIEEPPHSARFLLLTEDVRAVLPTIVSRSTRLRVPPLSKSELEALAPHADPALLDFAAGRPEILAHAEAVAKALADAEAFAGALREDMLATLEAANALEKDWGEWHAGALRFVWCTEMPTVRAALDTALAQLELGLSAYANPSLCHMVFALAARAAVNIKDSD